MCCQSLALLKVLLPNFQAGTGASSQKLHFLWKLSLSFSAFLLWHRVWKSSKMSHFFLQFPSIFVILKLSGNSVLVFKKKVEWDFFLVFQTLYSRILNGVERVFVMLVFCSTTLSLTQKSFSRFYRRKMAKTDRKLLKCLTLMTPKSKFEDSRVWQIVFQTIFKSLHVIFTLSFCPTLLLDSFEF